MPDIVAASSARALRKAIFRLKAEVPAPELGTWKGLSSGDIWTAVICQIAVVGSAKSGDSLRSHIATKLPTWHQSLKAADSKQRLKMIHKALRSSGVRYASQSAITCRKSRSAAYNFELLQAYGGPKAYFSNLALIPQESWRIGVISNEMQYIRDKGARDLLIGLGLAENAIALDSRLQSVLRKVGVPVPNDLARNRLKYKSLESELLQKVCKPCSITGAHFDRILFNRSKDVA